MSRLLTTALTAPIAVAALSLSLVGCGGSSTSSVASSAASSAASAGSSVASSAASAATSAASSAASAVAAAGSLGASCSQIDAVMEASPDADPAGTAKKLEEIKAGVTTSDADLIEALASAYSAVAGVPNPTPEQSAAVGDSAKALGAACQTATTTPHSD